MWRSGICSATHARCDSLVAAVCFDSVLGFLLGVQCYRVLSLHGIGGVYGKDWLCLRPLRERRECERRFLAGPMGGVGCR